MGAYRVMDDLLFIPEAIKSSQTVTGKSSTHLAKVARPDSAHLVKSVSQIFFSPCES